MNEGIGLVPILSRGVITEVNDTCATISITGRLGVITVPLRWIFADSRLEAGQTVEFYFSYMKTVPAGTARAAEMPKAAVAAGANAASAVAGEAATSAASALAAEAGTSGSASAIGAAEND
jgi:hypothetical protein